MNPLLWIGPVCFGIVVGWITYRTLRRSPTNGVSDLASVIAALGGATITGLFNKGTLDFPLYCVGIFVGFFAYLIVGALNPQIAWLGSEPQQPSSSDSHYRPPA